MIDDAVMAAHPGILTAQMEIRRIVLSSVS